MKIERLSHTPSAGWSCEPLPPLDSPRTLVLVFGASEYIDQPAPFAELRASYPQSHLMGGSSAGEIFGAKVVDGSLSVAVVQFEHTELKTAHIEIASAEASYAAGMALAQQLLAPDLRAVLVLSDGLQVNGSKLLEGLNAILPAAVVVTGGLAGDGSRFERTWTLEAGLPRAGCVSALGLYGDRIEVAHGSQGGWQKFGPERVITRSQGNVLYELDGKPALALYKNYLGERAAGLPATGLLFPLAVRSSDEDDKPLVRTLLAVDEPGQSLTFAGDLPEGGLVQLMRADFERLIDGASDAATMTHARCTPGAKRLVIAISCVGRRLVLGERTEEEIEATLEVLGGDAELVGFYSYGEISPFDTGCADLHNQTMTLTSIGER